MICFSVGEADHGKRIDRFLFLACSDYPGSAIYKAFKNKDVKINGIRVKENVIVSVGDNITIYLPPIQHLNNIEYKKEIYKNTSNNQDNNPDKQTESVSANNSKKQEEPFFENTEFANIVANKPDIMWEGASLLVVIKPQGIIVQSENDDNFENQVQKWWLSNHKDAIPYFPALCHRLDQNTGGLIMFANNKKSLIFTESEIKHHRIKKSYLCIVIGTPQISQTTLYNWLEKDEIKKRVYIHEAPIKKSLPIETSYKTLASNGQYSILHVEIATGRTHQIRAQLARIGHPIIGDSKYGSNKINRLLKLHRQALWAYRLQFPTYTSGPLQELSGITLTSKAIPWAFLNDNDFYWANDAIHNLDD